MLYDIRREYVGQPTLNRCPKLCYKESIIRTFIYRGNAMRWRLILFLLVIVLISTQYAFADSCDADTAGCTGLSVDFINAFPAPTVQQVPANETLLADRVYQRVLNPIDIYDAPNGNVVRQLAAGFNYVTTQGVQDNWTRINSDQWVLTEHLRQSIPSRFAGVMITEAMPYTVAWILVNVVPSRAPGAEPTDGDLAVLRYTRVNIYSEVQVEEWRWYQIGIDQWVHQTLVAKILPVERPADVDTHKWVSIDLYEQVAIAYEGATPVFATLISSGLADWPTNEGVFHVYVRYPRTIMSGADGLPDFYYLEEVPWTMYFDGDIGLHGTYWHDGFGYRHSHGCVNLSITDSNLLYNWASDEIDLTVPNDTGAAVYVYSSGDYR